MYDVASQSDEKLLNDLLNSEKYEILNSYDIHVALFVKYGKRDKEGNLKTPAITKNGVAVPAQIKVVSNFNRITDDTDVKIILNAELWEELTKEEKISTLDNMLAYLQIKEDKDGEPLTISESCDKVQIKLRHPDFYCEGFLDVLNTHRKNYIPWQDAKSIADKVIDDDVNYYDKKSKTAVETTKEILNIKSNKINDIKEDQATLDDETLDIIDSVLDNK
jgi:hypothetical protein